MLVKAEVGVRARLALVFSGKPQMGGDILLIELGSCSCSCLGLPHSTLLEENPLALN